MLLLAVIALAVLSLPCPLQAQDNIGGHVGFVIPWVTHGGGNTTTIADNFSIGFPFGVTFKGKGPMVLDMEFVPSFQSTPHEVSLLVHPGLVWAVGHGVGVGVRAAFDINSSQLGFTPLVNKSWKFKNQSQFFKAYFVEADLPVRFSRPTGGPATNAVTFATHFGLGF